MTPTRSTTVPSFATLARKEIANYLRSKLFWAGATLLVIVSVLGVTEPDERFSTTGDGLAPAALIGVLGIVVMAGMVRNSDRAAAAAGAVAVPQRTRTLALACAVVVPLTAGLLWFASAVVGYHLHPPAPSADAFGPMTDATLYAQMFAQGVMATLGGPLLGLVVGRWLPGRGVAPVLAVVMVLLTIVLQPLFDWAERPRLAWVWIHFHSAGGIEGDPDRAVLHTGSPYFYIAYLAALCVLGVLVAVARDPEADHRRLAVAAGGVVAVALALCALAVAGGPDEVLVDPTPSSTAEP